MKKTLIAVLLALALVLSLAACGSSAPAPSAAPTAEPTPAVEETPAPEEAAPAFEGADVNIAVLAGPTGIGAAALMEANDAGETLNRYTFTVAAANDAVVAGLSSGEFDIAAVATNVASNLYNKTGGGVQVVALNTYGVLYILEKGESISTFADLAGKTVYATGQGANPEFVLEHLLTRAGLSYDTDGTNPDADVKIEFMESSVLASGAIAGEYDTVLLPVPAVTSVLLQNSEMRLALDLTAEWSSYADQGQLTMGCVVVRREFAEQNPEAVAQFLQEYEQSILAVQADAKHAGELCETYGIVPKAAIATKAIPNCSLCFVSGADIQPVLEPYYEVLFGFKPASIGGALPGEDFYFVG